MLTYAPCALPPDVLLQLAGVLEYVVLAFRGTPLLS